MSPVDFTIEQLVGAPLGTVEQRLLDADFVAATSELPKLGDCRLLERSESGDRVTVRIHRRFDDRLPAAVTAVVDPAKLSWIEEIEHDLSTHVSRCTFAPEHYPDRLKAGYRATLETMGDRTHRLVDGQLSIRAFLASRPVERAIVSGLREYSEAEAELLSTWESS